MATLEGELLRVNKCLFRLENILKLTKWSLSTPVYLPTCFEDMLQVSWPSGTLFTL